MLYAVRIRCRGLWLFHSRVYLCLAIYNRHTWLNISLMLIPFDRFVLSFYSLCTKHTTESIKSNGWMNGYAERMQHNIYPYFASKIYTISLKLISRLASHLRTRLYPSRSCKHTHGPIYLDRKFRLLPTGYNILLLWWWFCERMNEWMTEWMNDVEKKHMTMTTAQDLCIHKVVLFQHNNDNTRSSNST